MPAMECQQPRVVECRLGTVAAFGVDPLVQQGNVWLFRTERGPQEVGEWSSDELCAFRNIEQNAQASACLHDAELPVHNHGGSPELSCLGQAIRIRQACCGSASDASVRDLFKFFRNHGSSRALLCRPLRVDARIALALRSVSVVIGSSGENNRPRKKKNNYRSN